LLDTEISEDLRLEGLAREIIRAIQELRKNNDFEISDRIKISYQTENKDLCTTFAQFEKLITKEVLATEILAVENEGEDFEKIQIEGENLWLKIKK
jgi:isoleucyl-tRNA synthetase